MFFAHVRVDVAHLRDLSEVVEVVLPKGEGCCGALLHHLSKEEGALAQARHNVDIWSAEIERHKLDAILITASGCGTMIKDYGFLLRNEPNYAAKATRVSALAGM